MSTATYLDHFLAPMIEALTPAVARTLVDLRIDPYLQAHINVLRCKANAGTLTPEEDAEYKDFVEAVDLMAILQSKARQFLAKNPV